MITLPFLWRECGLALAAALGLSAAPAAQTAQRSVSIESPDAWRPAPQSEPPATRDRLYPFYMPMRGLHAPAVRLKIKCDASRAAGREVYDGRGADTLYGRVEGGFEFIYEALDSAGQPCVYPFAPWAPDIIGSLDGAQFIYRSSTPGQRVTFRTDNEWATINPRLFGIGRQRVHFEMRDIELDFPRANQPRGALHLEATDTAPPGLFTAVVRRSKIYGGKNAIFTPSGQVMLYVEDSDVAGNVGDNTDQEHTTYINGTLVTHLRNSIWHGQRGWQNMASGHQLKDKAYLRIYENVTVTNDPHATTPSAMPLIDASAFGFTWSENLRLRRVKPMQDPREALIDLRSEIIYGPRENYPWPLIAAPDWRMPAAPLGALDKVYLSVFIGTQVDSFRTEPYVIALRQTGNAVGANGTEIAGTDATPRSQQRAVSIAFDTSGDFSRVYSSEGWTYVDPDLPPEARWVTNREAFVRHALGLIGRRVE